MKKISITAQLAAYTVSMLMGFGTFAAWNYVSIPQEIQMNEIPVINLASLGISTGSVAHASSSSPFGFLVDASALPAGNMNMPSGIAAPTPPDVPSMPGGSPGSSGGELVVLGVLPPDVVIISRGGKSITARTGQDTEFGIIGTVTMKGAYVNGAFIAQR